MAWAQFVQQGMQLGGGLFDSAAGAADAQASKTQGYRTADANEERIRARSAQALGEQRAAAAQSGFDPNSGSLATLQQQSSGNAELDALTERYKGQINAWQQDLSLTRGREKMNFLENPMSGTPWGRFLSKFNNAGLGTYTNSGDSSFLKIGH